MTTEPKHTPGDWSVSGTSIVAGDICIAVIEDDGGYEAPAEQREANAAIIASLPTLLADNERLREALRELVRLHDDEQTFINGEDDNDLVSRTLKAARAALYATEKP